MIWLWLNLFAVMAVKLAYDSWRHRRKKVVNHKLIWFVIVEVVALTLYLQGWNVGLIGKLMAQHATYWSVFDLSFNLFNSLPAFYIGNTAGTDKLFHGHKNAEQWMVFGKVCYLLVAFTLYILL